MFNQVLRRFFLIIKHMFEDTIKALEKKDKEWLDQIALMKFESDNHADYLRRAINSKFESKYRLAPLYVIIEEIEKVSDTLQKICQEKKTYPTRQIFLNSFITKRLCNFSSSKKRR